MAATTWPAPERVRAYAMVEFRAMASRCRIVTDTDELARAGEGLVRELEDRWSRFLPTSEVSAVNRADGRPCRVSGWTVELFRRAETARAATGGRFNPFVHDRLVELGYGAATPGCDRDQGPTGPVPNLPIEVVPDVSLVRLAPGVRFDPGGIGKGFAADLVVEHLVGLGARTVQVELGGDVRVHGPTWTGDSWRIDVEDPRQRGVTMSRLELPADGGAAATSSVLGTSWVRAGRRHHHLIDPATGLPSDTDVISVTTTSTELWWAEVVAKVALLAGSAHAPEVAHRHRCAALVLDRTGRLQWTGVGDGASSAPVEVR